MTRATSRRQEAAHTGRRPPIQYRAPSGRGAWNARYLPAPGVSWSVADGEALLAVGDTGEHYTLNGVATLIWELFDGRPLAAVLAALAEAYQDVPEPQLRQDLLDLVAQLRGAGLVREGESAQPN